MRAGEQHAPETEPAHEEREAENAVDDRRDAGEVLDVQLEQAVVPAVLSRVLLEVDGRRRRRSGTTNEDEQTPS